MYLRVPMSTSMNSSIVICVGVSGRAEATDGRAHVFADHHVAVVQLVWGLVNRARSKNRGTHSSRARTGSSSRPSSSI
jgi:hypothetical protein